jgi:hypothetical protein
MRLAHEVSAMIERLVDDSYTRRQQSDRWNYTKYIAGPRFYLIGELLTVEYRNCFKQC